VTLSIIDQRRKTIQRNNLEEYQTGWASEELIEAEQTASSWW